MNKTMIAAATACLLTLSGTALADVSATVNLYQLH